MMVYYAEDKRDDWARYFVSAADRERWVEYDPGNRQAIGSDHFLALKARQSRAFGDWVRFCEARAAVRAELGGSGRGIGAVPNAAEAAGGRQMGTLETIKNKIQDGDTAYKTLSRIADPARLCRWCTDRVLHDQRPATPRIVLAAAKECAETGYPGRLLLSMLTETRPTCGPEAAASVDAIVRR